MDPAASQQKIDEDLLRAKRRQKILQNRESRLKRLLGENSDGQVKDIIKEDDARFQSLFKEDDVSTIGLGRPPLSGPSGDGPPSQDQDPIADISRITSTTSTPSKDQQKPLISNYFHKIILTLLGLSLPYLIEKYLLLYFITWELVYFTMLSPPMLSLSQKSWTLGILFNLLCLACKLQNPYKYRLEKILIILSQLISDISLFIICSLFTIFLI